jgi:LysM repeat protein
MSPNEQLRTYFGQLGDAAEDAATARSEMPVLDAGTRRTRRPYVAVAASLVALAGIGVLATIRNSHTPSSATSATTTTTADAAPFKADTMWSGAELSIDGMTLQISIGSQPEGDGPCEQRFENKVTETNGSVTVAFRQIAHVATSTTGPVVCQFSMRPQTVAIRLAAPLGDRLLFDGMNPTPQPVWHRTEVVQPTVLPEGVSAADLLVRPGHLVGRWSQSAQVASGPGWDLWIDQAPAGAITPNAYAPYNVVASANVHGHAITIYEYSNHTGHLIYWTEGGLDITVRAELHTANMSTPQSFANPQVAFIDPLLIRIANGITIPPTSTQTTVSSIGSESTTVTTVTGEVGCSFGTYVVMKGDTPEIVARKFNMTFEELKAANVTNPSFTAFAVGSTVVIPSKTPVACTGSPAANEFAALVNRPWRVVAYGTVGNEKPVTPDYTNTLEFRLGTNGTATVSTQGCLVWTIQLTLNTDRKFVVGALVGPQSVCANPFDEGQHVADVLTEGATVRWSIGADARLTLTSATGTVVVYE